VAVTGPALAAARAAVEAIAKKYDQRIPRSSFEKGRLRTAREVSAECLAALLAALPAEGTDGGSEVRVPEGAPNLASDAPPLSIRRVLDLSVVALRTEGHKTLAAELESCSGALYAEAHSPSVAEAAVAEAAEKLRAAEGYAIDGVNDALAAEVALPIVLKSIREARALLESAPRGGE
jgi:hypothetical protein